jgi:hypothetical protein
MTFQQLPIGASFDFINDEKPMFNSFYLRCTKVSARKYQDQTGVIHRVGSIAASVYHVTTPFVGKSRSS